MPEAVGIYARISQDREGDGLGVARQLQDCRAEAARRGWPVAEEYVDDDISAYSGKPRPAYRRMLADLADRRIDGVIVWHLTDYTAALSNCRSSSRHAQRQASRTWSRCTVTSTSAPETDCWWLGYSAS